MGAEAMTSALLWAFAAVGFWTPHMEALAYPDLAACEQDRPRIERKHGRAGLQRRVHGVPRWGESMSSREMFGADGLATNLSASLLAATRSLLEGYRHLSRPLVGDLFASSRTPRSIPPTVAPRVHLIARTPIPFHYTDVFTRCKSVDGARGT